MKKFAFATLFFACAAALTLAFKTEKNTPSATAAPASEMKWYTWEEATELQKTKPKKLMIDVYTEWCGWCKKMDKSTFVDPVVTSYVVQNFYPVKLDAEQKADIVFNGQVFKFVEQGRRGVHTFAYSLLNGQMGYPSIVYLNEKFERILISPGYKDSDMLMTELKFTATEAYKTKTWEDYKSEMNK